MDNDQWFKNRLSGDFAESIAITHFSALGYKVERTGIENTAPSYAKLQHSVKLNNYDVSAYSGKIFKFHSKFPDFIASRVTKKPNGGRILNAIFIEVKYRTKANLSELRAELKQQYSHYITSGYPIFVYLLCKSITDEKDIAFKSQIRPDKFRVLFCYLGHKSALWWEAGTDAFNKNAMYRYEHDDKTETFNRIYKDLIVKHLNDLSG